ncbi:VCBS repeat-containing protein [Pseudooceanicola sp. CBS1P-1]|uniref:VCBS repeat-containing protein n=1 Tax=Pseudooceanicola albus TaxID=2692189 RepID=A0A6L7FZ77_9RHOB|nr:MULTISPECIES: VCBS repeat-containing protein [Pseudooceanicola]MBT9382560.1 VCBS repeat-containing protein [Pseudooceanicola endophyticus]MXN17101.1 hypothetical protein [Pseudooceanicola albus]
MQSPLPKSFPAPLRPFPAHARAGTQRGLFRLSPLLVMALSGCGAKRAVESVAESFTEAYANVIGTVLAESVIVSIEEFTDRFEGLTRIEGLDFDLSPEEEITDFRAHPADLNGDGLEDFLVLARAEGGAGDLLNAQIAFSDGTERFALIQSTIALPYTSLLSFADLDGDGTLDILAVDSDSGTAAVLIWTGGSYDAAPGVLEGTGDTVLSLALADVDGDGDIDLHVTSASGGTAGHLLLLNDGTGGFTPVALDSGIFGFAATLTGPTEPVFRTAELFADLDGDGTPELILAASAEAAGTSASQSALLTLAGDRLEVAQILPQGVYGAATRTTDIQVADLDGDGRLDLVLTQADLSATAPTRDLQILLQRSDGGFDDISARAFDLNARNDGSAFWNGWSEAVMLFDADADGATDILWENDGTLYVFDNDGTGHFDTDGVETPLASGADVATHWALSVDGRSLLALSLQDDILGVGTFT